MCVYVDVTSGFCQSAKTTLSDEKLFFLWLAIINDTSVPNKKKTCIEHLKSSGIIQMVNQKWGLFANNKIVTI